MMFTMKLSSLALIVLVLAAGTVQAAPAQIVYESTDLGGGQWEYVYTVSNPRRSPSPSRSSLSWFGLGEFAQLVATSQGSGDHRVG